MFDAILSSVNTFLYSKLLIIMLIGTGIIMTFSSRFVQFRLFKESIKVMTEKKSNKNAVSTLEAMLTSTAARVGTGNIIGVSTAICIGGYGAVFWMWLTAILGSSSAFVESTLAQIYKKKGGETGFYGGPSYYIEAAMNKRWLGILFAASCIFTYAGGFSMIPAYNLQSTYSVFEWYNPVVSPWIIGGVVSIATVACLLGGSRRIIKFANILTPIMGVFYLVVTLIVVVMNINLLPYVFSRIFTEAFDFSAIFGGFSASAIMMGVKRGLLSNEAGMGSAPHAAAAADTSHPVKQGLTQVLSVFLDTLVICSATAFMCFFSGIEPTAQLAGAPYIQAVVSKEFGIWGQIFICISVTLFGYTSIIGNYFYVDSCLAYLFKRWPSKIFLNCVHIAGASLVLVGSVLPFATVWDLTDVSMGLMALVNLPVIFLLRKPVMLALTDYDSQRKNGIDPIFDASRIKINNSECWK